MLALEWKCQQIWIHHGLGRQKPNVDGDVQNLSLWNRTQLGLRAARMAHREVLWRQQVWVRMHLWLCVTG